MYAVTTQNTHPCARALTEISKLYKAAEIGIPMQRENYVVQISMATVNILTENEILEMSRILQSCNIRKLYNHSYRISVIYNSFA